MAETEGILPFAVATVVEDVLQQQGKRLSDIDLASRMAEEASYRRYEAAGWLRKTVGVVAGKDLPAEPSEEEFRSGLRSGIILCNVLNKVQPGSIPKVVEAPPDSAVIPDGAALSAYQYFENVRNFLVIIEEMGLPTFEASDLEKGGKAFRIVNTVLALKSYSEWKQAGGSGTWKFGGNMKPSSTGKQFMRKNSEPFVNSISRNSSVTEKSIDSLPSDDLGSMDLGFDASLMGNTGSIRKLVRELLSDKKQEEIPFIVENILSKLTEEFQCRVANQDEQAKAAMANLDASNSKFLMPNQDSSPEKTEDNRDAIVEKGKSCDEEDIQDCGQKGQLLRLHNVIKQHRYLQELKAALHCAKVEMQLLQAKHQEEINNLAMHLRVLVHAASGYQKVLEENRKLYNQVQDLKGNIRVYCRVRPFLPGQANHYSTVDNINDGSITILTPSKYGKEGKKLFSFNKVFGPSATQEEVFVDMRPLVRSVLDGYNVCIFAYGQTGSGKTHTMTGPTVLTEEGLGVNYRALRDLFLISEQRKDVIDYNITVQMMEIYNEQVRDLLVMDGTLNKKVEIRNSSVNGINVPDANQVSVTSTEDVINLMNLGHKNRAVSATSMNDRSSRSHSCLTVHVHGRDLTSGSIIRGCMNLVDLAGSERVDKSEVVGDRLKEAQHINKSLSALGDVISSLAQKNAHVPYRNSKLTQLLQDSLGGQAKTLMFVHISPEPDAVGETISTLKFAERVSTVELGAAKANKDSPEVRELREQIAGLKAALARRGGESGRFQNSASSSPERFRMKSSGSSPALSSSSDASAYRRQSMDDLGCNMEVTNGSASETKRKSLDLQDLQANSPPWPPAGSPGLKEEDRESVSGDWIDKVMVNRQEGLRDSLEGRWEDDSKQLPEMFYKRFTPDMSKVYPEQPLNKLLSDKKEGQESDPSKIRYEVAVTDDSDDLDAATSDSSEADFLFQPSAPKVINTRNGVGSKNKKPTSKQARSPEISRSMIPAPPARRLSNGTSSPAQKTGKKSVEGKRKPGSGK